MAYKKKHSVSSFPASRQEPTLMTNQVIPASREEGEFYEIEPAEVLDVILNDQHPFFKTYEDIGKAKVRLMYSTRNQDLDDYDEPII